MSLFPPGFEDVEQFSDWARPTETGRNQKRWSSSLEESQAFYDAMLIAAPRALAYLDGFPLDALDPGQSRLLDLCLALAECSATIEMYGEPRPNYVFPIERFVPVHDSWSAK
jgi:hypothetical protein